MVWISSLVWGTVPDASYYIVLCCVCAVLRRYIQFLGMRRAVVTPQEEFEAPFYDYLQMPLQPLKDNLESATYEVFEKDPVKYVQYELAVCGAIKARHKRKVELGGDETEAVVVMVVGAGRGYVCFYCYCYYCCCCFSSVLECRFVAPFCLD